VVGGDPDVRGTVGEQGHETTEGPSGSRYARQTAATAAVVVTEQLVGPVDEVDLHLAR
jgi:hypothetical protein